MEPGERSRAEGGPLCWLVVSMTISAVLMASRLEGRPGSCCNNNYQNRNLNAGSGSGGPSNSDDGSWEREGTELWWDKKMIFSVRTAACLTG